MRKITPYAALYVLPFLIMLGAGLAFQTLAQKIPPGFSRAAVYAGLSFLLALGISRIVRSSQSALNIKPFAWGKPSSLVWGTLIGLAISATSGIGFGISQGYSLQFENICNGLPLNVLRQISPALLEEIVFRAGIVHTTLILFGKGAALTSGSVPFGILHLVGLLFGQSVTAAQIFGISLAGLMLTLTYLRFGILGAFGTHLTWNALVGGWIGVYGLTDKAAATSALEGSWVTCGVLAVACLALALPSRRNEVDEVELRLSPEQRLHANQPKVVSLYEQSQ